MPRLVAAASLLLVAAGLVAGAGAGAQTTRVSCSSGQTMFYDGNVRLFAVRWRTPDEWGYDVYACRGRRSRPLGVGAQLMSSGTASWETPFYALSAGGRHIGAYRVSDGEGGPSAHVRVTDLRSRRTIGYSNVAYDSDRMPSLAITPNGSFALADEHDVALRQGHRGAGRALSSEGPISDLAVTGNIVYWTEESATPTRSATVEGVDPGAQEGHLLEPAVLPRRAPCAQARGKTVAASPNVRIYDHGGRRHACRGSRRSAVGAARGQARVTGDRWALLTDGGRAVVVDARSGMRVTEAEGVARATLVGNGVLAWLADDGRLLLQRPADDAPTELAPASAAPTALAAGRRTVYWTAGGAAHQITP